RDTLASDPEAWMRRASASFQQLVSLAPHLPAELAGAAGAIDDPLHLSYYIANHIRLTTEQRQEVLALDSAKAKLEKLLGHMSHELKVLELGGKIQSQAEEQMGKAQREYFLREQLKAIQRELGELDPRRGPLRPGQGEAAHRRPPRGAGAEAGAGLDRPRPRTESVLRRAARRRQDRAGSVDRTRHGPQVCARFSRWCARRGGDPRPPAHVHRRHAWPHPAGDPARR